MTHAKSLRVIGESLDAANVRAFHIAGSFPSYIVEIDSLNSNSGWVLQRAVRIDRILDGSDGYVEKNHQLTFSPDDVSRLDFLAQKKRCDAGYPLRHDYVKLSQLLRALGDFLDDTKVREFKLMSSCDVISVEIRLGEMETDQRTFTLEKLQQLCAIGRFKRATKRRYGIQLPRRPRVIS